MKSAFVSGPAAITVSETDRPVLESGQVLVRMHACGICGSDLEKVFGRYGKQSMRLGHEPAGVVLGVGPGVGQFAIGERVFTHHHVPCHDCHFCSHQNETMCTKYSETNLSPCGLSEEYVVPAWNVAHGGILRLPDSVSFEEAAMIEPLACCVRAWSKISYQKGDSVAVFGAGSTGMMHVLLAQEKGLSDVFCIDVNDFRLDFAKRFGVTPVNAADVQGIHDAAPRGVDVAIVATSSVEAIHDAVRLVRKGGTLMMFGVPPKGAVMDLDVSEVYSKEISMLTSYAASDEDTRDALSLIESGRINVKQLITHSYSILDAQEAFEHARTGKDAMKIIIRPADHAQ